MEERGENGRKHVVKEWIKHTGNRGRGCIGKYNETVGQHDRSEC